MYQYKAFVTRVLDGDTYEMKVDLGFDITVNTIFRLFGVDTPETWRPKTKAEKAHGTQATNAVRDLIEGKEVIIITYKKGKYGRYLCDIIIETENGDVNIAKFLVDNDLIKKEHY